MRPVRLEVQGLTAYRQPVAVDFSDLDLFAITGPTGAGKSSLVDAITYALFGQVPRVGRSIKELISQGEDRVKVSLEFTVGTERYRIHRSSARKGQTPVQLEHQVAGEWLGVSGRASDATAEVEKLLRMDYDAFVRSVLLPQGEFQQFLAGDPGERRKVLDGLLQLDVYYAMGQRANAIAARQTDEANHVRERLDTELRDATPEALAAAREQLEALKVEAGALDEAREALAVASRTATIFAEARQRVTNIGAKLAEAEARLAEARMQLAGGEDKLKDLDAGLAELQRTMTSTAYDSEEHLKLAACQPLVVELARVVEREQTLAKQVDEAAARITKLESEAAGARKAHETAQANAAAKREAFENARRTNAAVLLRQGLTKGDACPVCGQAVGELPAGRHVEFDRLKTEAERASQQEVAAGQTATTAEHAVTRVRDQHDDLQKRLSETTLERQQREAQLAEALGDVTPATLEGRLAELEKAKSLLEALSGKEKTLRRERDLEADAIAAARKDLAALEADAATQAKARGEAAMQADEAAAVLRDAARQQEWLDVLQALQADHDPAPLVQSRLARAEQQDRDSQRQIGAGETRIAQIEKDIKTAKDLRKREKQAREAASLARDLARDLRADRFPTFIRERALQTLAVEGSHRLEEISGGRYEFQVEGQDFLIVDRWNGGETRSVKTLSGGETFLASLALALALAEHLPALASGSAESALESLFIDEGFSHLDNETLDVVASALEVLGQDRRRLIGVITHVPALAERMPARITVHKSQGGSTVTVE